MLIIRFSECKYIKYGALRRCKIANLIPKIAINYSQNCNLLAKTLGNKGIFATFASAMIYALVTALPLLTSIVMLVLAAQALSKRNDKPMRWLLLWNIAVTILYGCHLAYFNHLTPIVPITDTIYVAMNLLVYPLYHIYISEVTERKPLSHNPYYIGVVLSVPVVAAIAVGSVYLAMDKGERIDFINLYLYNSYTMTSEGLVQLQRWLHLGCHVTFAVQVVYVIVSGSKEIRRFNKTVNQLYADTEHREIKYIPALLLTFIVTSLLSSVVNIIGRDFFVDSFIVAFPAVGFSVLLAALAWVGISQRFSIHDIPVEQEEEAIDSDDTIESVPTALSAQIYIKLEDIMNERQIFLQQDILLNDVAKLLGTNRTYLLRALSSCAHMTFKEYINRKRIAYAEQLIAKDPDIAKSEVATLSGYNSLSSFYRNYNIYRCNR